MDIKDKIEKALTEDLHLSFSVVQKDNDIIVYQDPKDHKSFYLKIITNESRRLTIICEPDRHGVSFMETLNSATAEQRENFCLFWDELNACNGKVEIAVNERKVSREEFCSFHEEWKKIYIRFSKLPYCRENLEDKEENLISYIELVCEMLLTLCPIEYEGNGEGNEQIITSTKYERDPINRRLCIMLKGCRCAVCGFDFQKVYGEIGRNFIEVHHIVPVSELGAGFRINPTTDLIPLCSNCHSMIHRKQPPYTPEELKEIVKNNISTNEKEKK